MAGVFLPAGYSMTFTASAVTAGNYALVGSDDSYTTVSAGATATIGPFNNPRQYEVRELTYTQEASGVLTGSDDSAFAPKASPTFTGTVILPATTSIGTVTGTEIGYLDNVTSAIQTQLNAKAPNVVTANVGTAATNVVAVESGDAYQHTTVLTVTDAVLPAIAGTAAEAEGVLLYTLPAGACIVKQAYMSLGIQQQDENITADTPDGGLGTSIATGEVATLDGTPAFENIITGQAFDDCDGTAEVKTIADQVLVIEAEDDHTVYFNVADTWAASGDTGPLVSGTIVLHWQFIA